MRNIYIGDTGVFVQYMQLALNRAGYPAVSYTHLTLPTKLEV